jgi:hypothetical protein
MTSAIRRWLYWFKNFRNYPKELNRRAAVEQQLWNVYHGKQDPPDREKCREWALQLGVPDYWRVK